MDERIEVVISGRVQVVMYRDFATRKARGLGLVGEVKNLPDGTVRVVAEGPRATLERFVKKLHRGSLLSRVDGIMTSWLPYTGAYRSFDIAYD